MRTLRVVLEGEEFIDLRLRRYAVRARREGQGKGRSVLKPVTLDVWTRPESDLPGQVPADWDAIGIDPPTGRCSLALLSTGQTVSMVTVPERDEVWLVFDGVAFLAVFTRPEFPAPPWPWRVVHWHDRHAVLALLGATVLVWPRRSDGFFDPFSEPLKVTSAYHGDDGRLGIGLSPALQPSGQPAPLDNGWPLRRLSDGLPSQQAGLGLTQALRPTLVLWSSADADKPVSYLKSPTGDDLPLDRQRWLVLGDAPYDDVRVVLADPAGSDPGVWEGVVPAPWAGPRTRTLSTTRSWAQCWACEDEGVYGSPVLVKTRGLCLTHYARQHNQARTGRAAQERAFQTVPKLGFAPRAPAVALDLTAGLPSWSEEDD